MLLIIIAITGVLITLVYFLRKYIKRKVESGTIELNPEVEEKTKLAEQKGIQRLEIDSGKYKMFANWKENGKGSPSIIIYHGNGESLSDWVDTQLLLNDMGFNSLVFDYTGFGSSKGKPSVDVLNQNAISAWEYFCEISNSDSPKIAIGHSLGAAIILGSIHLLTPSPNNLVLHAPFSTAREIAVHFGSAKKSWVWMMPDVWNNKRNIKKIRNIPSSIIHSKSDKKIPFTMSKDVSKCNPEANLLLLEEFEHNDIYENPKKVLWRQILGSLQK